MIIGLFNKVHLMLQGLKETGAKKCLRQRLKRGAAAMDRLRTVRNIRVITQSVDSACDLFCWSQLQTVWSQLHRLCGVSSVSRHRSEDSTQSGHSRINKCVKAVCV